MENKKKEILTIASDLIAFPSVTGDRKASDDVFDYIKTYCNQNNLYPRDYENNGFRSMVISINETTSKQTDILFHGHIDVVPANEKNFTPTITDNKLYGRGSLDMKGGLAILLTLFADLAKQNPKPDTFLLLTSDEETNGEYGTGYLLENQKYTGNFFITAEDARQYLIKVELKGILRLKIIVNGSGGQGAHTWESENAIKKLYFIYSDIEKHFPHNHEDPERWYTTINLGKIHGGHAANAIPEHAEAEIDIRYCGNWNTAEEIYEKIQETIHWYPNVSCEILSKGSKVKTDTENYYVKTLHETARETLNTKKNLLFKNHATNDARFAAAAGIPAVGFGPIGDGTHAQNEFVYIDSLTTYYTIIKTFLSKIHRK